MIFVRSTDSDSIEPFGHFNGINSLSSGLYTIQQFVQIDIHENYIDVIASSEMCKHALHIINNFYDFLRKQMKK